MTLDVPPELLTSKPPQGAAFSVLAAALSQCTAVALALRVLPQIKR